MTEERIIYLTWEAPSRLFKKRDKEFFRNIGAIVFFLLVILIFAREFPLILAVIAVSFLVYVFSTVQPENVKHILSNKGVETGGRDYKWSDLKLFWFDEQWGQKYVTLVTEVENLRVIMLLGDQDSEAIKEILNRFIKFEKQPQKTLVDNAAHWLSRKIPLEKSS